MRVRVLTVSTALSLGAAVCQIAPAQNGSVGDESLQRMPADADPSFEVATIKPSSADESNAGFRLDGRHIAIEGQTVNHLLLFAYGVHPKQIVDGPSWFATDRYDIDGVPDVEGEPSLKQWQGIVKKLLAERFQLSFHQEKRELAVYAITVAKGGPKLTRSKGDPNRLGEENDDSHRGQTTMKVTNMSMAAFTLIMQAFVDRPVVDQSGLAGRWDFQLTWTRDESRVPADANAAPGLFTAIQEQLGLKLDATRAPADVFAIDHAERPSAN